MKAKKQIVVVTGSEGIRLEVQGPLGYRNPDRTQAVGKLTSYSVSASEALRIGLLLIDAARTEAGGITNLLAKSETRGRR